MKANRVLAAAVAVMGLVAGAGWAGSPQAAWGESAAGTEVAAPTDKAAIGQLMKRVADYQLALNEKEGKPDPNWVRAVFYTGVMATYRVTGDEKYAAAARAWCEKECDWKVTAQTKRDGEMVATSPGHGRRHADRQAAGQTYCELYMMGPRDERMLADLKEVYAETEAKPAPGREEWWWCDSLFMGPPTLARLYKATGDEQYLKLMDRLYWDATAFLYDPDEHLFYRDAKYFPEKKKTANGKKVFWSRGNGWVVAGLTRVLDCMPSDWPTRSKYEGLFKDMCGKLVGLQGEDGMWRASLLDAEEVPNPEESGSAFFVEAFAWGIRNGLLDEKTYGAAERKGWGALVKDVNAEGRVGWVQRGGAAPAPTTAGETYEFGVGGWLLAAEQVEKLSQK